LSVDQQTFSKPHIENNKLLNTALFRKKPFLVLQQNQTNVFTKKHFCYLLSFVLITLVSCQKEVDDPDMQPPTASNGGNNSGSYTYMPLTKNTYWRYKDSITGLVTAMTVLDKKKTINGRTYTAVLGSNNTQNDTAYMTQQNREYFNYAELNNGASNGSFLFHYLNDTAAVGSNWEYLAGEGNGFPAYFKTTIIERDLTHTVLNRTYNDVIHTRMEMSYDIFGVRTPAAIYEYYVAKNVGIIQVRTRISMLGVEMTSSSDLMEYQIK
jgi:hypothetical protein